MDKMKESLPQSAVVTPPRSLKWIIGRRKWLILLILVLLTGSAGGYFIYHRHQLSELHQREQEQRDELQRNATTINPGEKQEDFIKRVGEDSAPKDSTLPRTGP